MNDSEGKKFVHEGTFCILCYVAYVAPKYFTEFVVCNPLNKEVDNQSCPHVFYYISTLSKSGSTIAERALL